MKPIQEPNPRQGHGSRVGPARAWLSAAFLALLVAIVYLPTLGNGIILDDRVDIRDNVELRSLEGLANIWFKPTAVEQYYPLTYSTLWAEYHRWGLDWRRYHLVNLLLHAAAAVLLWRLLVQLSVGGAWLAAAIFAVHPVEVESVAWLNELKNVLSLVLAIGSLAAYLRFSPPESGRPAGGRRRNAKGPTRPSDQMDREPSSLQPPASGLARGLSFIPHLSSFPYYLLAFVLYVAALLAKTATASVPAVLLVIYWWKQGRVTRRDALRLVPFFAVGLALSLVTIWMEKTHVAGVGASGPEWDLSPAQRVLIAGRAVWFYAGKLAWPHPLTLFYPRWTVDAAIWWQYLFPAAAVAAIVVLWLARKQIGRGPLAAVLIFAGVLAPGLGFFNVYFFRFTFVADHFQYHASAALIALAAAGIAILLRGFTRPFRWSPAVACATIVVPLAALAHQQTYIYKDDRTVAEALLAADPQSWLAHHYLGACLEEDGNYDQALSHFLRAIEIREQLVRENPTISDYRNELAAYYVDVGLLQRQMGHPADAENWFRKAIGVREQLVRERPEAFDYQDGLAWCYSDLGYAQHDEGRNLDAEASHRKAISLRQKLVQDHAMVAKSARPDARWLRQFRDNLDQLAASHADLGLLERDLGQAAAAEESLRRAIDIREELAHDEPTATLYRLRLAACYDDLAITRRARGQLGTAADAYRRSIEIREQLARDNPATSRYQDAVAGRYVDLGLVERDAGRLADAARSFRKAIEIREKLVRSEPSSVEYQRGLAWCYAHLATVERELEAH